MTDRFCISSTVSYNLPPGDDPAGAVSATVHDSEQLPPEQPSIPSLVVQELYKLRYTAEEIADFGGFADAERAARVLPLRRGLRVIR